MHIPPLLRGTHQDTQVLIEAEAKPGLLVARGRDWDLRSFLTSPNLAEGMKGRLIKESNVPGWWIVEWMDTASRVTGSGAVWKTQEHRVGYEGFYDLRHFNYRHLPQ